jgi:hypothetical protein
MTQRWHPPEREPWLSDADFTAGCGVGCVMGLVGVTVGSVALLILRQAWIVREGDTIDTIVAGLAIGWFVAVAIAILANVILVAVMSAMERVRGHAPHRLNVGLLFVVPAVVAATALWLAASINR